jgi:hypothetical protein
MRENEYDPVVTDSIRSIYTGPLSIVLPFFGPKQHLFPGMGRPFSGLDQMGEIANMILPLMESPSAFGSKYSTRF